MTNFELAKIAYRLAKVEGYKYCKTNEYISLSYSDKLKVSSYVTFLLEQER